MILFFLYFISLNAQIYVFSPRNTKLFLLFLEDYSFHGIIPAHKKNFIPEIQYSTMLFSEVYTKFGGYYYIAVPLQQKTTKNNSLSPNPSPKREGKNNEETAKRN